MSVDINELKKLLKTNGYSSTSARTAVFQVLDQPEPQSISEIIASLPSIDRTSVYRTIDLFERLHIVNRLNIGWKYKIELSDKFHHHHHHIVCNKCRAITELPESKNIELAINELIRVTGFTPISHQIEIVGICSDCSDT